MNFRTRLNASAPLYFHVTPFVDILLVLLAFFVLTWSVRQNEADINIALPEARNGVPQQQAPSRIILNIGADGTVNVNQKILSPPDLQRLLETLVAQNPKQVVVIRADQAAPYRDVIRVLDTCRGAKISNLGFASLPKE